MIPGVSHKTFLLMNFRWTWSISLHHLYCLFILLPLLSSFPHLTPFNSPAVYLQFLFCPSLSNLYTLTSPLPLHFLHFHLPITSRSPPSFIYWLCPLCFSSSPCSSHLCPLVSSLIGYSFTCFFPFLFSISPKSFFLVYTRRPLTSLHLPLSSLPLHPSLPSSTVGQTRVDKVEKKPVLTSEGISIYNQNVCVPADQQQL